MEQQQIISSHNLAGLTTVLGLRLDWPALIQRAWGFVVKKLQALPDDWYARLQHQKNAAFAWRQLLFFAAVDQKTSTDLPLWFGVLEQYLEQNVPETESLAWFRQVFLQPLARVLRGEPGPRNPVLGWVSGDHPLNPKK